MSSDMWSLVRGRIVHHAVYGVGSVVLAEGATVIVRFEQGTMEVERESVTVREGLLDRQGEGLWDVPLDVVCRMQGEVIRSINASWGVFARTRVELLPHQLWVVRQVTAQWPTRWLIADDVGLGKSIEAGLIVQSLVARAMVRRVLVLCPAALVEQWVVRMRKVFEVRFRKYASNADTEGADFWGESQLFVTASLETLRRDNGDRHQRILEAPPWDLVIVDEAHHLNADEATGQTLGYRFIRKLEENKRIGSMLFFTGTPHRGKDFGFVSILQLLRPSLFDARRPFESQLGSVPEVVIRNNKASVTNLAGERLFRQPVVRTETYEYSPEEARFYELLTEFIASGRAYAGEVGGADGRAIGFVLVAMQKLASSSVAAIRRSLELRKIRLRDRRERQEEARRKIAAILEERDGEDLGFDEAARQEEEAAGLGPLLQLQENEGEELDRLLAAAEGITEETKTRLLMTIVQERFAGRSVLFFTEYKGTQAAMVSALMARFGRRSVTFINGDERLVGVRFPDGTVQELSVSRERAAESFNSGETRFLVSTEAGGEGIDLQESCHVLVHVDLPWNPMRLHQRTGRLYRYGQRERVEVLLVRNRLTVEGRIWELLEEKIHRINVALGSAMEEPEDLAALVLGMASPRMFEELFAGAPKRGEESLRSWFDEKAGTLGGEEALRSARQLLGNVSRFDFGQVGKLLPQIDLPDLARFFENCLTLNNRRLRGGSALSFLTPEAWCSRNRLLYKEYEGLHFVRKRGGGKAWESLLGVGHQLFDTALADAVERSAALASLPEEFLRAPLVMFRIRDRVSSESRRRDTIVGTERGSDGAWRLLFDWEVLARLNELPADHSAFRKVSPKVRDADLAEALGRAEEMLRSSLDKVDHGCKVPDLEPVAALWPRSGG